MKEIKLKISDEVKSVLEAGRVEGNIYYLPEQQLSREMYMQVNKILETLGGKWNRSKRGHCFAGETEAQEVISSLDSGEVVDKKKTYQFFETPREVAELMVELLNPKDGQIVLEPSAGHGAIAEVLFDYTNTKPVYLPGLIMVEIDKEKCEVLEKKKIAPVICQDFLSGFAEEYGTFPRIIMNPPFTRGQDAEHVLYAYENCLENGGKLVSVMSNGVTFNQQKKYQKIRKLIEESGEIVELPEGAFKESGTLVKAVIVVLNKP